MPLFVFQLFIQAPLISFSQVTGKERAANIESMTKDIATIVSEKCVNTANSRPYTVSTIMAAMKDDIHFGVSLSRAAKQQALDVIKQLQAVMPISRARICLRVRVGDSAALERITAHVEGKGVTLTLTHHQP